MLKSIMFVAVLTLSCLTFAQNKSQREALEEGIAPHGDATTTCQVTYTSGTGENATQFCVTSNGNITQFSRFGVEMIKVGIVGEGYGFCDTSGSQFQAYYDYAYTDSGNWLNPTFTQSGNTVTITRTTSDGIWQLKQTILNTPATATSPGTAKITMALKNLSAGQRRAILMRYADVDVSDSFISNDNNDFDSTTDAVQALGVASGTYTTGLSLTNSTLNVYHIAFAQNVYSGPAPCTYGAQGAPHPFSGDGSIVMVWDFGYIKAKAAGTAVSTYKPI